ncbi:MAG: flagellar motor stator protein MotA [Pirellulales bacterium]
MIVLVGCFVVLGAVIAGFTISGGHVGALIHPAEILTIGGAATGALIVMSPAKVLKDLARGILQAIKGGAFNKQTYAELFGVMYELFRSARRDGLLALEQHVSNPHDSALFNKYPRIVKNHHVTQFICGSLSPLVEGSAKAEDLPALFAAELRVIEDEHHAPISVLAKTADALPGFGIVAAVLGIVITMGHIDGPVEEIGHKVGAALVGTFLGILLSYGFVAPLVGRMEMLSAEEMSFFRTIVAMVNGFANDRPPKIVIEQARRGVGTQYRPTRDELDELFKAAEAG